VVVILEDPSLSLAILLPDTIQPLCKPAFLLESFGLRRKLPVKKMAAEIQQRKNGIGNQH
jgi:hypothetical protein